MVGGQKLQSLIQSYNYYLQMMRDVTGLNEARDGSTPDKNALVGLQKLSCCKFKYSNKTYITSWFIFNIKNC